MDSYRRGDLTFDVIDRGPADGPPMVLLHGFPQFNSSWEPVMDRLVAQGYRCLAPNQRGYSPRARPPRRRDYRFRNLAGDVLALMDAIGDGPVHLVGHDLGAAVGWQLAVTAPERVATLTALSVPHPAGFKKAMRTSRQGLSSWYIYAFQFPGLPEMWLSRGGGRGQARAMQRLGGQTRELAERDGRMMAQASAFTGALNWYRAMALTPPRDSPGLVSVPTQMVWSDGDAAVKEKGVRDCGDYVTGDYRLEILRGVSHWLPDQCPDRVADLILEWASAHPIAVTSQ
jgi:pimeloyl-ACP methyl ester carboxylesterase